MANTFAPQGFQSYRRQDGASWTANQTTYQIQSTNTNKFYRGDPVTMNASGYVDVTASGTLSICGIFQGASWLSAARGSRTWSDQFPGGDVGAGTVTAYVIDDPNATFIVQVGTTAAVGGPAVQADIGLNAGFQFGTPNTLSGLSGAYLDYTTHATTSTLPFRILSFVDFPPGVNGTDVSTAGNLVEVAFNNQQFKQLTGI